LKAGKRYSVIIFDLGNTLIRFDHNISAKKLATIFSLDQERVRALFFDSDVTRLFEKGFISAKEFYEKVTALLGIKIPYKDFVSIWNDIFWEDKDACDIARELKSSYRLFLLSNVNKLHYEYIKKNFDIIKIFDEVIASFAVGAMKPQAPMFEDAVKRAGGDKSQVLYIDDREDLIKEANEFGIESIRFEGADKLRETLTERGIFYGKGSED
jgi:glucose-1-phosphatase